MKTLPLLAIGLLSVSTLFAQSDRGHFEVSPFAGYESGASAPVQQTIDPSTGLPTSNIERTGVNKDLSYGTFVDYSKWENIAFEFMWARNPTAYTQHDAVANQSFTAYDSTIDQYQFGAAFSLLDASHKLRPYIAGGLGFAHGSNSNASSDTSFAWSIGGGAKYYLSRHFGLRGDARLIPTYANSIQGQICDPYYGCYYGTQRNYFHRINLTGGIVLRF